MTRFLHEECKAIALRWIKDNPECAMKVFRPGRNTPELTYLGAPIEADFELSYANLAPHVTQVLDLAAPIEGAGGAVELVVIKERTVKVF